MGSYQLGLFMALWVAAFLLTRIGLSVLFKKAGYNPILAFIPILSWWWWLKVVNRPKWYMIGMVIPCINILFSFNITLDLLRSFGQFRWWQHFVGTVFTFIYLPYMAFDKNVKYLGGAGDAEWRKKNIPPHRGSREWADALLFAMYVAGGMRSLYFDLYQIPTPSMESNLMVGDFLVVSRAKIGMRIPMTPIAIPVLAHKELMGMQAFSDILELPYMRLGGWYTIKNNDVIVFNWPADEEQFPVDKKENYVKRCVGVPGDSLKVVNGQVYINNKKLPVVGHTQKRYLCILKETVTQDFLLEYSLGDYNIPVDAVKMIEEAAKTKTTINPIWIYTWPENADKIKGDPRVKSLFEATQDHVSTSMTFPNCISESQEVTNWDINDYGPIYLPKRGDKITLTKGNWEYYKLAVNKYEKAGIEFNGTGFSKNGEPITSYTFKLGYYWMMGDNRYNSLDSRFWGYVPEDHVVGKPLFTFLSIRKVIGIDELGQPKNAHGNPEYDTKGIRWEKILKTIE